jgi:hypothetical protein
MKTVLWVLLALNGLLAVVWLAGLSLPPQPVAELTVPAPSAKPLQLLSELPALPPRLDALPADDGISSGAPQEDVLPPDEPPAVQIPSTEPQIAHSTSLPAARSPEPVAVVVESTAQAAAPASPPPAKPTPAKPPAAMEPTPPVEVTPAPIMADPPVADGVVCYRTAALAGDVYEAAGQALRGADLGDPVLQPQDRARPRHWVYWTGAADEQAGIEERLKAAGVRDWYRLRAADGVLRISLGVYGQADGARRRQHELAAKGIQTQISERYTPQARLRWTFTAPAAAVAAARDSLQRQGVRLEVCP